MEMAKNTKKGSAWVQRPHAQAQWQSGELEALRESEERYRTLLELAPDAVLVHQEGRLVYVNAAAVRFFGAAAVEALLGRDMLELVHPAEREMVQQRAWQVLEHGELVARRETRLMRLDGQEVAGETAVARVIWMGTPAAQVIVRDITERKRAEAELRESQERFREVAETLKHVFWVTDPDPEKVLYVSPAFERIWGRSAAELYAQPRLWTEAIHPEDRPEVKRAYEAWLKAPETTSYDVEYRLVRPDGSMRWISDRGTALRGADGQIQRLSGVAEDITERKQAEEAQRRSEAIYRAMAHSIPGGAMSVVDKDLRYLVVEGALLERLGLRKEAMTGRTVEEVFEGRTGPERAKRFRRAWAGEVTSYETEYHGRIVWSQFVPLYDQEGQVMAAMSLAIDVTERKRAEEALQNKSERLRLLSEAAGDLLSGQAPEVTIRRLFGKLAGHMDLDMYFNFHVEDTGQALRLDSWAGVSEAMAREIERLELGQAVCGTVAQERQARVLNDVQHSEEPKAALLRAWGVRAYACFPLVAEERLVGTLSFGSRRRQEFSAEEVELLRAVSYYVAAAQAQSWHRQDLERTVGERTTRLREMVAELEHLSYSMVHDMRAPLRAIEGCAVLIERGESERLNPQSRELVVRMGNAIHQMDQLITDVLSYNQALRRRLPMGVVEVDRVLRDLLGASAEVQPPRAEVQLVGEFPRVQANTAGLMQCLGELLRNGVKFVEPGKLPRLRIWAEQTDNPAGWVRVWVEDNGTGIPKEGQSRIFDLFQRMHGAEYPGTGIGLALVRKLVERMGGQVGVESEPGRGSRFWVKLRGVRE